jgi:hypothetical protein
MPDTQTERDPGICVGCAKDVEFRGEHNGRKYCTNYMELGNFVDDEEEADPQENETDEEERPECPHCGEPQDKKGIGPHKRFCHENPANQEESTDDESADAKPSSKEQSEEQAEVDTEATDEPPERISVKGGEDEETVNNESDEKSLAPPNGSGPSVDHYTVSVLRVQPPEYDHDLFVAYTESNCHSAATPDQAVAGLVSR